MVKQALDDHVQFRCDIVRRYIIIIQALYKFIPNTVGHYVHTYTRLHIGTTHKHTYQDQCGIKYLHEYRSKLHYFTS